MVAFVLYVLIMILPAENPPPAKESFDKIQAAEIILQTLPENEILCIEQIVLKGNRLTRERILRREILFHEGDTLSAGQLSELLEQSRLNLLNTALFNFVEASIYRSNPDNPDITVEFVFVERWNIWPAPIFELDEPNFNHWLANPGFEKVNYGLRLVASNITGRNERISFQVRAGYEQSLAFLFYLPYINKAQTVGWGIRYGMNRARQRAYITQNNDRLFVKLENGYASIDHYVAAHTNIRPAIFDNHRFALGYHQYQFADTLLVLNPRFSPLGKTIFSYLSASYSFRRDKRDVIAYPLSGFMVEAGILRKGLGIFNDKDMDATIVDVDAKYYLPLSDKWFMAASGRARWSEGSTLSYFDQPSLGYVETLIRGYENHVVDGHRYLVLKTNIKYNLLPQRVKNIGFIRSEKFSLLHYAIYLNVFMDGGLVKDPYFYQDNPLSNKWLTGYGVGLDLVTYYDKVLRTEFSLNRQGEAGFFVHMVAPI